VYSDERLALLALAEEALELQAEGEQVMAEISGEGPLDELSRRGGPLISRFEEMRREVPECGDPMLRSAADVLGMIFANHALALHSALDLLAVSWRSERMREELHRLEGLGRPAIWLHTIRDELAEELEAPA
jgi:hypothetical protein